MSLESFPENWIEIATNTAKKIAPKFLFGSYTLSDLIQHSLYVVMNESHRYDPERGTFVTFCYVLIHSRLHSLKRDKYERHDAPCNKCPLHAYIKEENKCNLFDSFSNCKIYHEWEIKNQSKKLLTQPVEASSERKCRHSFTEIELENEDFFLWAIEIVNDKEGLRILLAGGSLPTARMTALMVELKECVEDEGLE